MSGKIVYQADRLGFFVCETIADESPLEPGVFHIPAGAVEKAPPASWPENRWPRWNGSRWLLVTKPKPPAPEPANDNDPVEKLRAFLIDNPDVAAILQSSNGGANV